MQSNFEFTAAFDEKFYPVTGNDVRNGISLKRIDAYTVETKNGKEGKPTTASEWTVSKDGKTYTNKIDGVFPNGQVVHNLHVYDKQ